MIASYKNENGLILAYAEWRLVGQSGFDKLNGEYIYIADFWIHESHKNDWSIYRELMRDIFMKSISAKFIYFVRRKYGGRMSKLYSKEKIMKLVDRSPAFLIKELA